MDLWDGYMKGDVGVQAALRKAQAAGDIFHREEVADFIAASLAWPLRQYFQRCSLSGIEPAKPAHLPDIPSAICACADRSVPGLRSGDGGGFRGSESAGSCGAVVHFGEPRRGRQPGN